MEKKKNEKRKRKKKGRILFWAKGHKQHCGVSKYMLKLLGAVVLLQSLQSCGDICKRAEQDWPTILLFHITVQFVCFH